MDFTAITHYDLKFMPFLSGPHSDFADTMALTLTSTLTWIPLYLVLLYIVIKKHKTKKNIWHLIACVALCLLLADGMADGIVKPLTERLRPLNDPITNKLIPLVEGASDNNYSFFSAHAANTFSICVFFLLLIRKHLFTLFMLLWSLTNCWTRIYLGMHYPSDILVGLLWGAASGTIAYYTYCQTKAKTSEKAFCNTTEYTLTDAFPAIAIIIMTIAATAIYHTIQVI